MSEIIYPDEPLRIPYLDKEGRYRYKYILRNSTELMILSPKLFELLGYKMPRFELRDFGFKGFQPSVDWPDKVVGQLTGKLIYYDKRKENESQP